MQRPLCRQLELQRLLRRRFPEGNLEMDFYGGWKAGWGDFGLDLGALYYYYPGSHRRCRPGHPRQPGG